MSDGDGHQSDGLHPLELAALAVLVQHAAAGAGQTLMSSYQASGHFLLQRNGQPVARVRIIVMPIDSQRDGT